MDDWDRITDLLWKDYAVSPPGGVIVDRIKYGYDKNGSRLWRENDRARANSASFDWLYWLDETDCRFPQKDDSA